MGVRIVSLEKQIQLSWPVSRILYPLTRVVIIYLGR